MQLEIGLCQNVLEASRNHFGHLGSTTLITTLWGETEPNNIFLRPHQPIATPYYQGTHNIELMRVACRHYNCKDSIFINRYRLYLQVTTLYDIITYDGKKIHPQILHGECIDSRQYHHTWVQFRKPPKWIRSIWKAFLDTYIAPILQDITITWNTHTTPNYSNAFFLHLTNKMLYKKIDQGYLEYMPKTRRNADPRPQYQKTTSLIQLSQDITNGLTEVDVSHEKSSIIILCSAHINTHV